MNNEELPGLYLHVPFCRSKCLYCDFYSTASPAAIPAWLQAVQQEGRRYRDRFPLFNSLYLGGGTPTILGVPELAALMQCLHRHFTFHPRSEITIEANPDDISPEKLKCLRDLGINRISLGVQSLADSDLQYLGRSHRSRQALHALELIRSCDFAQLGIDLMYGLQTQNIPAWKKTLTQILAFEPEHLSCYQLTLEKGSALGKKQADGLIRPIDERLARAFFVCTSRYLERHGYQHYEISNFARSRETRCRHNQKYWNHAPYLGLGPSAHSFQAGRRWWNVRSIKRYCQLLEKGKAPVKASEALSDEQLTLEALLLGLRTSDGMALPAPGSRGAWSETVEELRKSHLIALNNGRIHPTRKGFLVADSLPLLFTLQ